MRSRLLTSQQPRHIQRMSSCLFPISLVRDFEVVLKVFVDALFLGYSRVVLAGLALHYMSYHPKYCTLAYGISCLLDAVDGHAARALGQTSKFGAVLDMVTDR